MAWPDLTLVADGALAHMIWSADTSYMRRPIRFASDGAAFARMEEVTEGLASIVDRVLVRLSEQGIAKSGLADEWDAIAGAGTEEQEFCITAAKLGLDPYSVSDELVSDICDAASSLPDYLLSDFFDSADSAALPDAVLWTRRAVASSERASSRTTESLTGLYSAVDVHWRDKRGLSGRESIDRPWLWGYEMARQVRNELAIDSRAVFDPSPWVGQAEINTPSKGIQGVAAVNDDRCGLVLGLLHPGTSANRFGQARALGRVLARPQQKQFILSLARGQDERVARAFAAELLAPADGIREYLGAIGKSDDTAIEAVARRYRVSPLLVRHQYDNQIAKPADRFWM